MYCDVLLLGYVCKIRQISGQRIFPVGGRRCQEYSVASLNIKNLMSPTPLN